MAGIIPTNEQIDRLRELINIGAGRGANVLNNMLNSHIKLQVPFVKLLSYDELLMELDIIGNVRLASVNMPFRGIFSGNAKLIFPSESALKLVAACTGEPASGTVDIDSIRAGTLTEIGNIVLNSVMGTISNLLHLSFNYSIPGYTEGCVNSLFNLTSIRPDMIILLARTRFIVEELNVEGDVVIFFELGSFDTFLTLLDNLVAG
jgi:chemotaxis protein CheC